MNNNLEQLKLLVFKGGYDPESRQEVIRLEKALEDAAVKEKLAEQAPFKDFVEWATDRIQQAQLLLHTDRKLTDRERDALFERIDDCDQLLSLFGRGTARASVESVISDALARAKNS